MQQVDVIKKNRKEFLSAIMSINSIEHLDDFFNEFEREIGSFDKFVVTSIWKWFTCLLLICLSILAFFFVHEHAAYGNAMIYLSVGITISILYYAIAIMPNKKLVSELTKELFFARLRISYNISTSSNLDYNLLVNKFSEFNRGDEGRKIISQHSGAYNKFHFQIYTFQYVEVTTSTDSKGNRDTHKTTYYRYGVLCDSNLIESLKLSRGKNFKFFGKKCWTPTAPNFNKIWSILKGEDFSLAKFFTPNRVLEFVDFADRAPKDVTIEVTNKQICVGYSGKCLFDFIPKYNLSNYKKFKEYILNYKNDNFDSLCDDLFNLFNR